MLDETLDTWLHRALLFERFGPLQTLAKEQCPVDTYADVRRRRRVLLGEDAEPQVTIYPQAVDL